LGSDPEVAAIAASTSWAALVMSRLRSNCIVIDVRPDDNVTAWELYGKYHGYAACLRHGKVRVVRHDVADDNED